MNLGGIVTASVVLNVALLAALIARPALLGSGFSGGAQQSGDRSPASPVSTARSAAAPSLRPHLWAALETEDLRTMKARLHAAGFPPHAIRAILTTLVDAHFERRQHELYGTNEKRPFWKSDAFGGTAMDFKQWEDAMQLLREYHRQLRGILGDDVSAGHADPSAEQRRRFGNLSAAKIARLQAINDDYAEMESQLRTATLGVTLPADLDKFALLEREKKADLAASLTAQELEEYEMRSSYLTTQLRPAMMLMNATEEEFRAIFRVLQAADERSQHQRASDVVASGAYSGNPESLHLQVMAKELKAALGEQRYSDYLRASSHEYQHLQGVAQRERVPPETVARAFAIRDSIAAESARIYHEPTLTLAQKHAALQTLAQRARAEILSTLGPAAGPAYLQAARWITPVERGSMVIFGPENSMGTRRLPEPATGASSKR